MTRYRQCLEQQVEVGEDGGIDVDVEIVAVLF
jgi:hypothetical protein